MRNRVALLTAIGVFVAAVAALAVVADQSGDGDGDLPALTYASGGVERSAAATASADIALYPGHVAEYRLAKPLPKPAETAPGYRVVGPDEDDVARLAKGFGLRSPRKDEHGWVAKGDTADAGELRVDGRSGTWWFGPSADTPVSSDTAISECRPCPPDTICTMECKPVERPEGVPTEAEAERAARELWGDLGIDPGKAAVEVEDGYASMTVHFAPLLDGVPVVGVDTSVNVGPHNKVLYASGWLLDAEKLGDYPLITVEKAVDRLNNPPAYGPRDGRPEPGIAEDSGGVTGSGGGSEPSDGSQPPVTIEPVRPLPPDAQPPPDDDPRPQPDQERPMPLPLPEREPEPQVVTLTGVRLAYQFTGTHLAPVYIFSTEHGTDVHGVPAVPDDLLDLGGPRPEPATEVLND